MIYPKRLIEVDLPIRRISANARREKNPLSAIHIWWARRPLAACRVVICASLWPDPADSNCPKAFREAAEREMLAFAKVATTTRKVMEICDDESWKRYANVERGRKPIAPQTLRVLLLDFIADFAAPEAANNEYFLSVATRLTQASHDALTGTYGSRPLVVDPFSGGGSVPFEALRVGADAFASDLNPVAVLINKVMLEYAPRHGQKLASELRRLGKQLNNEAAKVCGSLYPNHDDGTSPVAYLWARTIRCEGPGCGVEVPVLRSLWIDKSSQSNYAYKLVPDQNILRIEIVRNPRQGNVGSGTSRRSSVTCPACGYTTPRSKVEIQAKERGLGQVLMAVVVNGAKGREYRTPSKLDLAAINRADDLCKNNENFSGPFDEELPYLRSIFNVHVYGIQKWRQLFSSRQFYYLSTLAKLVLKMFRNHGTDIKDFDIAIKTLLSFVIDKLALVSCNVARWRNDTGRMEGAFSMMALPMVWDWAEWNPFNTSMYPFAAVVDGIAEAIDRISAAIDHGGTAEQMNATRLPIPDDSAALYFTDPPYYDYVPYANLSDFFYVWLRRLIGQDYPSYFSDNESPKAEEIVQLAERNPLYSHKTREFFEQQIELAFSEGLRLTQPGGLGAVVFAHKSTTVWETLLNAIIRSGWVVTASWPIDTELVTRFKAINTASLVSSVHLICRPRENSDGSLRIDDVGDWREVLAKLPIRIHEWMPRLAEEGVVGADAIFACLGPALEIFSRYSKVEKANGNIVTLKEYLEQVWAAVSKEALNMIFAGADATGFEEDARLTAMWLWTLSTGVTSSDGNGKSSEGDDDDGVDDEDKSKINKSIGGFGLEYDAARKIAQGLGAHLENMKNLVEIKGDMARLLSVSERSRYLFGREQPDVGTRRKKKIPQAEFGFMKEIEEAERASGGQFDTSIFKLGKTVLDQVHQTMLLFAAGRSEAVKRFLVEDGVGRDQRFWRLAQALSALYPSHCDEKRWIDGVLARKKGLGF